MDDLSLLRTKLRLDFPIVLRCEAGAEAGCEHRAFWLLVCTFCGGDRLECAVHMEQTLRWPWVLTECTSCGSEARVKDLLRVVPVVGVMA